MDINSIKGLSDEELINLLGMLFVNMNNLDKAYYDMFFNPVPMTIDLERYNDSGVLETITVKNRAMDRLNVTTGRGTPEGVVTASTGALYHDILTNNIYIKIYEESSTGWILLHTSSNFLAGTDYLKPDGDGSQLQNISFSKFTGGIIKPIMGGTGVGGYNDIADFKGILKANGEDPCTIAKPRIDYTIPEQFIGAVSFFACNPTTTEFISGWLPADGSYVPVDSYPELYDRIKATFGAEKTVEGVLKFALPDLRDKFIRATNNTARPIGKIETSAAPNITGQITADNTVVGNSKEGGSIAPQGAFYNVKNINYDASTSGSGSGGILGFSAAKCSAAHAEIYLDGVEEIRPANIALAPFIYAGVHV